MAPHKLLNPPHKVCHSKENKGLDLPQDPQVRFGMVSSMALLVAGGGEGRKLARCRKPGEVPSSCVLDDQSLSGSGFKLRLATEDEIRSVLMAVSEAKCSLPEYVLLS